MGRAPEFLTVEEAAERMRVSRTKAYLLAKEYRATGGASGLPVVDLGDLLRVPRRLLEALVGTQVAQGIEEYYLGGGEAPGVWHGSWASELGLEGIVDHDHLRNLLDARHPIASHDLVSGHPGREVKAFDATFSPPKSASLLWAF